MVPHKIAIEINLMVKIVQEYHPELSLKEMVDFVVNAIGKLEQ